MKGFSALSSTEKQVADFEALLRENRNITLKEAVCFYEFAPDTSIKLESISNTREIEVILSFEAYAYGEILPGLRYINIPENLKEKVPKLCQLGSKAYKLRFKIPHKKSPQQCVMTQDVFNEEVKLELRDLPSQYNKHVNKQRATSGYDGQLQTAFAELHLALNISQQLVSNFDPTKSVRNY